MNDSQQARPRPAANGGHFPWMISALGLGLALRLAGWLMLRRAFFCGAPGFEDSIHQTRILALLQSRFAEEALPAGSPLYPYLAALLSAVAGGSTSGLLLIQSLIGLATIPLVAWAFAPLLGPRARWIAALVYALHPIFVLYDMRLQPVVIALPLLLAGLRLALLPRAHPVSRSALGGLVLGVGALFKPFVFLAAGGAGVVARAIGGERRVARAIVFAVAVALLPAAFCVYQTTLPGGGPSWNWTDALGFYQTLRPATWGTARSGEVPAWLAPDQALSDAKEAMEKDLSPWETTVFYRGRALQSLVENPVRWIGQIVKRALLLIGRPEIPDPVSARFVLAQHALPLAWGLFLWPPLLALAWVGFRRWRGSPELCALAPLILGMLAVNLLGTYSAASRVFLLVALLPLIAVGLESLPALARRWRTARLTLGVALAILLVSALDPAGGARRFENESEDQREAAGLLLRGAQDRRGATVLLRKAIQLDARNPMAHADLGGVLSQEELPEAARLEYGAALAIAPECAPALYGLAEVLRAQNRNAEAESVMTRLVTLHPNHPLYLNQLAAIQILQGRFAEARFLLRRALEISPLYQVALINLRAADDAERRATSFAFPPEMTPAPESELMKLSLSAANAWRARDAGAADSLTALVLARFPAEPMAWYVRGMYLDQTKRFAAAAELLTRVVRAVPGRAMTAEMAAAAWRDAGEPAKAIALMKESLAVAADDANRARLERALEEMQATP
jgi:tetratricopeptide (TPR) repeat protein